jgi:hypothetical protein
MKVARLTPIILIILMVISTCKNEFATRDFPSVLTVGTNNKGSEGVEFTGEIIGRMPNIAIEAGFIWQKGKDPVENPGYKMTFPGKLTEGKFNIIIRTSLKKNTEYYVRAYAKSADIIVYGDVLKFTSPEDFKPGIISVSPITGLVGDTINIKGGIYNSDTSKIVVRFNELRSKIVSSTDSLIRCLVPMSLSSKQSTVSITDEGPVLAFGESFILSTPSVSGISAETVQFNDTISINGTGFHKVNQLNIVRIGSVLATVISSNNSVLKVIVPFVNDSLCQVSVTVSGQTGVWQKKVRFIGPEFDFFEPVTGNYLDTIIIHCKNIKPWDIRLAYLDNIQTRIVRSGQSSLTLEVPTALKKEFSDLRIIIGPVDYTFDYKFRLNQPVISSLSAEKVYNFQILTITGSGFNPLSSGNKIELINSSNRRYTFSPISSSSNTLQIRILNPETSGVGLPSGRYTLSVRTCEAGSLYANSILVADTWRKLANFTAGDRYKGVGFSINGFGYAGLGTKISNQVQKDLWKFDPATESWTRMTDFPGTPRLLPYTFVNSNYGFVGGGVNIDNFSSNYTFNDFYRYDPVQNAWTRIADPPYVDKNFTSIGGSSASNYHIANLTAGKFYGYSEAGNNWTQIYSGEGAVYTAPYIFSIGTKIYFVGGIHYQLNNGTINMVWEYNTLTNTFTRKNDFPFKSRWGGFAFSIDNKGYIGCGVYKSVDNSVVESLTDVFRYNPEDDSWIQIDSFPGGYRIAPSTFVIGHKAYVFFGYNVSGMSSEMWEFYPGE